MRTTQRRSQSTEQPVLFELHAAPNPEFNRRVRGKNKAEESPGSLISNTPLRFAQVRHAPWLKRDPDEYRREIRVYRQDMRNAGKDNLLLFGEFERLDRSIADFLRRLPTKEEAARFEIETEERWCSLLRAYEYI